MLVPKLVRPRGEAEEKGQEEGREGAKESEGAREEVETGRRQAKDRGCEIREAIEQETAACCHGNPKDAFSFEKKLLDFHHIFTFSLRRDHSEILARGEEAIIDLLGLHQVKSTLALDTSHQHRRRSPGK